jgi:ribosomal-protein-alanine N-acetyltransferase
MLLSISDVTARTDIPDSPTRKRSERFVSWMSKLFERGNGCAWVIENRRSKTLLGAIRINEIEKKARCGVIGYELHPGSWGKGLMSEALAAVVVCGHSEFNLNRLEAWTCPGNSASDRVLLKNGFTYEGTLRQKSWFKGEFQDLRMFGRLIDDAAHLYG